jgi:hypothetical protein
MIMMGGVEDRGRERPEPVSVLKLSTHSYRLHRDSLVTLTYLSLSSYVIGVMQYTMGSSRNPTFLGLERLDMLELRDDASDEVSRRRMLFVFGLGV